MEDNKYVLVSEGTETIAVIEASIGLLKRALVEHYAAEGIQFVNPRALKIAAEGNTVQTYVTLFDDELVTGHDITLSPVVFYEKEPVEKKFPNGFTSWQETHYEMVAEITLRLDREESARVNERHEQQGIGGLYELAEELTDAFEEMHKGVAWGEDENHPEYFEAIEAFVNKELA